MRRILIILALAAAALALTLTTIVNVAVSPAATTALVKAMLPHQWGRLVGQTHGRMLDRAECRIINPTQPI